MGFQKLDGLVGVGGFEDREAGIAEFVRRRHPDQSFVLDDEDDRGRFSTRHDKEPGIITLTSPPRSPIRTIEVPLGDLFPSNVMPASSFPFRYGISMPRAGILCLDPPVLVSSSLTHRHFAPKRGKINRLLTIV
ncbi:hypothetical protein K32_34450 [Kaistia sp. 32K]|nr:hypothetical protein K32_34450 [Kaistia sp. 32K]